eukprot:689575-Pelagomonas_calceolata.AAC.1
MTSQRSVRTQRRSYLVTWGTGLEGLKKCFPDVEFGFQNLPRPRGLRELRKSALYFNMDLQQLVRVANFLGVNAARPTQQGHPNAAKIGILGASQVI